MKKFGSYEEPLQVEIYSLGQWLICLMDIYKQIHLGCKLNQRKYSMKVRVRLVYN